ncbi:hypothetical protein J4Q44_G00329730 [Coregonus suidteri]|uniref:Laminin G domain-containing protein n=1 Tax=Coregonus suidteri TaxID=861788 RepID=A0AAN8L1P5_9TELE
MGGQQNYFLLAVVRGNLSIQTSRGDRQILVTSGPKISDGEWKKLNTPLDGCMRNWDWVRQNSSILEWTLQDSKNDYILSLKLNHPSQELMLRLRGTLFWSHSYTQALCSEGVSSFHGCLQAKIQGVNVDLDLAEVKHGDVRSHSCPAALDVRDGK